MSNGWHLDKNVSVGHILTTATIIFAGAFYIADLDKKYDTRTSLLEAQIQHVKDLQGQQNQMVEEKLDDQSEDIKEIKKLLEQLRDDRRNRASP